MTTDLTPQEVNDLLQADHELIEWQRQEIDRLRLLVGQLSPGTLEPLSYPVDPQKILRAYTVAHNIAHQVKIGHARLLWPLDKRSGPFSPDEEGTPHQLWGFIRTAPAWPWNIRVMADGTVEQRQGMSQDELNEAEYVLWGGHVYDIDMNGDLYATLVAAGYSFIEGEAT